MNTTPAIKSLAVRNLLSFGDQTEPIELKSLNVLIGPNGVGKSNLLEAIGLLQNAPKDLGAAISNGGGIEEWLWKGAPRPPTASIDVLVSPLAEGKPLRYSLSFTREGYRFQITDERIENERQRTTTVGNPFFAYKDGGAQLRVRGIRSSLKASEINHQLSILAQLKDPRIYPEITYLGNLFGGLRLYRDWEFGSLAAVREPGDASLPDEFLEEDASNLGVVLNRLLVFPKVKESLIESLRTFYPGAKDVVTSAQGSKIQVWLQEQHLQAAIPLIRMSDGTVRWLALLAILLNPSPPPLVCIEEPEMGLHPDMIHELGKLLIDASRRMQLIVTTHSDTLIEEFSEVPEAVVVCEKERGVSRFRRLDRNSLAGWLEDYSLGQIWRKGHIGGNRW